MPARTLPGIALQSHWDLGEDGWKPGMDSNMLRLSVLVQTAVLSSVAAYPGSPSEGDMHRLTGTADEDDIIVYDDGAWVNFSPFEGMTIWDIAAQSRLTYSISGGWASGGSISAAEIKTAYESNGDTNAFTDAEKSKLGGVETGATADQTASEIKAAYESNSDTNAFTDAEKTKLAGLSDPLFKGIHVSSAALDTAHPSPEAGSYAYVDAGIGQDSEMHIWDDDDAAWVLGGGGGTAETPTTVKSKYESNADTNAFTDAEKSKLAAISGSNTGDQTITLTGDVSGAGTGSFMVTVVDNAITNAKLANMVEKRIKGRSEGSTGDPQDLTPSEAWAIIDEGALGTPQNWNKAQGSTPVALTDGALIATDAALSNVFTVTLGGNRTLDNPGNLVAGRTYVWLISQDATGGRTLAFGSYFDFPGGVSPTMSTGANAVDMIVGIALSSTRLLCAANLNFS